MAHNRVGQAVSRALCALLRRPQSTPDVLTIAPHKLHLHPAELALHLLLAAALLAAILVVRRLDKKTLSKLSKSAATEAPPTPATGSVTAFDWRLDALSSGQRQHLVNVRAAYSVAGGALDDYTDWLMLRFLVASRWDERRASEWAAATAKWRAKSGAAAIRAEALAGAKLCDDPDMRAMFQHLPLVTAHRTCHRGWPLTILHVGGYEPAALWTALDTKRFHACGYRILEFGLLALDQACAAQGRLVRRSLLLDYSGLAMKHMHPYIYWELQPLLSLPEKYYPELVGRVCCVNAPALYAKVFRIIAPWLGAELVARISVVAPPQTSAILKTFAPAESMPAAYGGSHDRMPPDVAAMLGIDAAPAEERQNFFYGSEKLRGYARAA